MSEARLGLIIIQSAAKTIMSMVTAALVTPASSFMTEVITKVDTSSTKSMRRSLKRNTRGCKTETVVVAKVTGKATMRLIVVEKQD